MKYFKAIFFSIFAAFLLYRTIELIRLLSHTGAAEFGIMENLVLALILNLFITGIFAFPGFVSPSNGCLPKNYYSVNQPQQLRMVYRLMLVRYFRLFLMVAYWGRSKNRQKYFNGKRSGMANLDYQSKQSEFGHLAAFMAILVVTITLIFYGHAQLFLIANIINLLANGYPILLQRHHRMRIQKLTLRQE